MQQNTIEEAKVIQPKKKGIPKSVPALVLGIVSIATCYCYGTGIIVGAIALTHANRGIKLYHENPDKYTETSFKNLNAGRITAIIGLSLSAAYLFFIMLYFIIAGAVFWATSY